jgi:hypothetical protein
MKTRTVILAGTAVLALGVGSAIAGPCTAEIDRLAKTLAAKDAGSGPTSGASGASEATQSAPTRQDQHPPTAIMGKQTEGKAASPQDVQRQTQGQPTAAQQGTTGTTAGSGDMSAPYGEINRARVMGMAPATADMSEATAALDRARALDQQGNEAECMEAARQAGRLAGPR